MLSGRRKEICFAVWMGALACGQAPVPDPQGRVLAPPPIVQRSLGDRSLPGAGRRRALLVGIDDYSASRLPPGAEGRRWRNLQGAVNDAQNMQEMLKLNGFAPKDVLVLANESATRAAILKGIETHLLAPAQPGDILLFYFAGHGSQVRNSLSGEEDRLDESLVPADSRRGGSDIRDKELSRIFNRLLNKNVHLTVILDSCHSGSGVRGLPPADRPRALPPDLRDVADGAPTGPRPEDRGALVFSATQDFGVAWETEDEQRKPRGAFSLALLRAMKDAAGGEPAEDVFARARALMQAGTFFQEPVLAGPRTMRQAPFLGDGTGRRTSGSVIAVERVKSDGTVVLQGGWVNGLAVGSEVRLAGSNPEVRLEVTAMLGLSRCEARPLAKVRTISGLKSGALAEVVSWAAPPDRPLRVSIPQTHSFDKALALAKELAQAAPRQGIEWIDDPTEKTPTHVLHWLGREWELLGPEDKTERLGPEPEAELLLKKIEAPSPSLFVQLPLPAALARSMVLGPGTDHSGVEPVRRPEGKVDYVLAGRLSGGRPEFAWLRPGVDKTEGKTLPVRTDWQPLGGPSGTAGSEEAATMALEDAVLRLRKIHAWLNLPAPEKSPYRLAFRQAADGGLVTERVLRGGEQYGFALQAEPSSSLTGSGQRYVYVFLIDSAGRSVLLFPTSGSVENRVPAPASLGKRPSAMSSTIPVGPQAALKVTPPYGHDTYFLLTSEEAIPNPWVLEWAGVRTRGPLGKTPLEELLSVTGGATRSGEPVLTPPTWTIERLGVESVPPGGRP